MDLIIKNNDSSTTVFNQVLTEVVKLNLNITTFDFQRPWGGFIVIDENKAETFASIFFPQIDFSLFKNKTKLSPKILIVAPQKRLSWQYHFRRTEIWKVIHGPVGIKVSDTDQEGDLQEFEEGSFIKMNKEERHRLIGLDTWGIVAEIWQHTDSDNHSDEDDIIRLQDDYGR